MGLAKNVLFLFGTIMVYLQVHIIRDPAYQVLLGRLFDAITESNIQNLADGGQMVTLRDPNSGSQALSPPLSAENLNISKWRKYQHPRRVFGRTRGFDLRSRRVCSDNRSR